MKTVLITGCSSGFGLDTARYFLEQGWHVIAMMRTPRADVLPVSERLRVIALDVTDEASIRRALDEAGPIDVLVNNAGIGMLGALEGTPMHTARDLRDQHARHHRDDAGRAAAIPRTARGRDRQRDIDGDASAADAAVGLFGKQGGGEHVHGIAGAGTGAARRARASCCRDARRKRASAKTRRRACRRPFPNRTRRSPNACSMAGRRIR